MIRHWHFTKENKSYYLCNQAVTPNEMKMVEELEQVTCKNCKKILGIE